MVLRVTARTRRVGRGALLVMVSVCATARAAGEDEHSESPWRVELAGHGAWLPGEGTRGAAGAGVSVGYTFISLGIEAWAYHPGTTP